MTRRAICWLLLAAVIVTGLGSGCVARSGDRELTWRLDGILGRLADSGATYAARVVDLESGAELYAHDADRPMTPASNMKIPVTAAGLDLFGGDYAFATYFAIDGDDLWVIGTGDPGIGDPRLALEEGGNTLSVFDVWADELVRREIKHVNGALYYYDGALDGQWLHPSWAPDDILHWYGAPVGGLNFNDNCVDFTVYPAESGQPAFYQVMPPVYGITVLNECVSGAEQDPNVAKLPDRAGDTYRLYGTCAEKASLKSKPVSDPGAFFCDALRTHLAARGIVIDGSTRRSETPLGGNVPPPAEKTLATYETRVADVLRRINTNSQNFFAEALCKLAGREFLARQGIEQPGSWAAGEQAVRDFLRREGIDDRGYAFADGSGLSRENKVTARLISDVFVAMARHPEREVFLDSLSQGGRSGTLSKRFKGFEGRVFAKTGYIEGVRALSGYVVTDAGRWLVFSIIYNGIPGEVEPFEALQDEAVRVLGEFRMANGE